MDYSKLSEERRSEIIDHCNNELSALRLSLTLSCLSESEVEDIKIGIATHEVALASLLNLKCESIVAGVLSDVRDSLTLNPHQNAVISCAIDRLNAYSLLLNQAPILPAPPEE